MSWVGIGLVGIGVLWESLLAPSAIGWGFVLLGFLAMLAAERQRPGGTPLDWPLLLLIVMGGVSLLITALPQVTQVQVMRLGAGLAGFYGLANWARDRTRLLLATMVLMVGGIVLALFAPFVVDWNRTKSMLIPALFYEPFPLLVSDPVHPNVIATLLVLSFPLPLAWLMSPTDPDTTWWEVNSRLLAVAACILLGVTLLLTKSRGGYIAGALGGLTVMWLSARKRRALALMLVATLIAIGASAWLLTGMAGPEDQTPELVEGAMDPDTWAFRQQVWRAAAWMLADFPFTGVGMGLFNDVGSLLYALYAPDNPGAHNLYFQVGVDLGVPGLVAYLAVLMSTLWMAGTAVRRFRRKRESMLSAVAVGTLAGMVALMAHGLVDIGVWGTRAAFFPWLTIGLSVGLYRLTEEEESTGDRATGRQEAETQQP
jgi:putative inorganic carbon (HCO3(-)) transporter